MGLFSRSVSKLSGRTALLLTADPGDALLDSARLYVPDVRPWHGRLVFHNGVLLFGPVTVTPELEQRAGLPAGTAVAYYTGAAVQKSSEQRSHEAKRFDGDRLVRGLADRLGGTVKYAGAPPDLALVMSVYSEQTRPRTLTASAAEEPISWSLTGRRGCTGSRTRRPPLARCVPGRFITGICIRTRAGSTLRTNWPAGLGRQHSRSPVALAVSHWTNSGSLSAAPTACSTLAR